MKREDFAGEVLHYFTKCQVFKREQKMQEQIKKDFENLANEYFYEFYENDSIANFAIFDFGSFALKLTKVQRTSVKWNIDRLKQVFGKKISRQFIRKKYEIKNFDGLVEYLKTCGVNPKKFSTFLNVTEEVDENAIDNLYQLGKVKNEDLETCYSVNLHEPYFRITKIEDEKK